MIDQRKADEFLHSGRIAVVGASDDPKNFGGSVHRALVEHGINVVSVNPTANTIGGARCYPTLEDVPGEIAGVIVMVSGERATEAIRATANRSIPRVWLFKGLGGTGSASPDAIDLAHQLELDVIPGACPLMFLEPVRGAHRVHHAVRRLNRSLTSTG